MKIIICGPKHSGKTVLTNLLEKKLPADSFITIRVNKDGEGNWSNNENQDEVQLVRVKESYDEKYIALKCDEIEKSSQQIVLVDIGGKLLDDKIPVFKACDAFVVLSKEKEMIPKWHEFGEKNGCKYIAEIFSDLDGKDCLKENGKFFKAVLSNLNRGRTGDDASVITALAEYLITLSGYKYIDENDEAVIDFNKLAVEMGRATSNRTKNGEILQNVHFEYNDSSEIMKKLKDASIGKNAVKINGARANWCSVLAVKTLFNLGVSSVSLFDSGYSEYIPVRKLVHSKNPDNDSIVFSVLESQNEIFVDGFIKSDKFTKEDYEIVKIPEIPENKILYLSGRIPNWLMASIACSYKNQNQYLFQPGNGYVCVQSENDSYTGSTVTSPKEIDTGSYFENRKKELSI